MRVLGVDPGLTRCGVGVIEMDQRRRPHFLAAGVVRTNSKDAIDTRLLRLHEGLVEWLDEFSPDALAIERVFAQHNLHSVTDTAQAAGIAILLGAQRGLPVAQHTPSEIKAAVCGNGRAGKAQVATMITHILKLSAPPKPADAADAIALAICHGWRGTTTNRYAEAVAKARRR